MADDLGAQLKIQQEINSVLAKRSSMLKQQEAYVTGQAKLAKELCSALDCQDLDGMEERIEGIRKGMAAAADAASDMATAQTSLGDSTTKSNKKIQQSQTALQKLTKAFTPARVGAVGLGVGLVDAFRGAGAQIRSTLKFIGSLTSGIAGVGTAIIKAPFRLLGGLTQMANDAAQAGLALRQEYENVRKQFGDLSSGPGKAVIGSFKSLKSEAGNVAGTGLSMSKMFGFGPEGAAKALAYLGEQAHGMGPAFHHFKSEIAAMGPEFVAFTKGLGISGEQTGALANLARTTGRSLKETLQEVSNYSLQMGDAFGIAGKEIAQDMAQMAADVGHFGQMAPKQLAQVSVYAHKLGIEVKALTGLIDKFDNFEDAAKSASMLSQAFGMNVDAMKMMQEQDPAKRMEMLRNAFFQTGKSVEDLSRQELKLLSSQMGLDENATKLALSNQNLGYDDVLKESKKAEKGPMSQAEAMKTLSKSIERAVELGHQFTGFFDALIKGFMRGVMYTKEFRELLQNLRASLRVVFHGAMALGNLFITRFPGVIDMVKALRDMFDPVKFHDLMQGVIRTFRDFCDRLKTDPQAGIGTLLDGLKQNFSDFFASNGGAGSMFLDGAKKFFGTLAIMFMAAIPMVIQGLTSVINKIADFIANPGSPAMGSMGEALKNAFIASWAAIQEAVPVLVDAVKNLLMTIWTKYKGPIVKIGAAYASVVIGKMLLVATLSAVKGAVAAKVGSVIAGFFGSATSSAASQVGSGTQAGSLGKALKSGFGALAEGIKGFFERIANLKPGTIIKAGLAMAALAVVMGTSMILFSLAMVAVAKIISLVPPMQLVMGFLGLAMASGALALMIAVTAGLGATKELMVASLVGMLAGAALLTVGGVAFALALLAVSASMAMLDPIKVVWGMAALGMAALALLGLIAVGAALGATGPAMLLATAGILLAPVLLYAAARGFIHALIAVGEQAKQISDPKAVAMGLGAVAIGAIALAALVGAVTLIGLMLPQFPIAIAGVVAGALFLAAMPSIVDAIGAVGTQLSSMNIDWKKTAKTFVRVASMFGSLAIAASAAALGGLSAIVGAVGLGLMVYFLLALPPVLEFLNNVVGMIQGMNIDWKKTAKVFGSMGDLFYDLGSAGLAAIVGGAGALIGVLGLVLMAPMLLGLPDTIGKIKAVYDAGKSVKWGKTNKMFAYLGSIFANVGIAGLAAVLAGVGGYIGSKMIPGVVAFVGALTKEGGFLTKLGEFSSATRGVLTPALSEQTKVLGEFFGVIGKAALLSIALLPFTLPFIGKILMKGFNKIGDFGDKIAGEFAPAVGALSAIEINDPASLSSKMEALGAAFEIIGTLANVAVQLVNVDVSKFSDASAAGAVIDAASGMINGLISGVSTLITSIIEIVKDFSEDDMAKAASVGKLMGAIGTMVQSMMPPDSFFDAIKKVTKRSSSGIFSSSSSSTTTASGNAPEVIRAMADFIRTIMRAVSSYIPEMVRHVKAAADSITNPAEMEPKMKIVGMAIEVVSKVGKTMKTMFKIAQDMAGETGFLDDPPPISEMMSRFSTVMSVVSSAMRTNMRSLVTAVVQAAESITDPAAMEPKMKIVGMAMDMVVKFGTTIKKLYGLMPSEDEMPDASFSRRISTMTSTISDIVWAVRSHLPRLISSVTEAAESIQNPRRVIYKMKIVGMAMEAVVKFGDTLEKLKGLKGETDSSSAAVIRSLVGTMIQVFSPASGSNPNTIPKLIEVIATSGIAQHSRGMGRSRSAVSRLASFTEKYAEFIETAKDSLDTRVSGTTIRAITQMITDYNVISESLQNTSPVRLSANLDRFGRNLRLDEQTVRIRHSPINVNVVLNLTMDAKDISTGLATQQDPAFRVTRLNVADRNAIASTDRGSATSMSNVTADTR